MQISGYIVLTLVDVRVFVTQPVFDGLVDPLHLGGFNSTQFRRKRAKASECDVENSSYQFSFDKKK